MASDSLFDVAFYFMFFVCCVSLVSIYFLLPYIHLPVHYPVSDSVDCSNKSLVSTAYCLNDFVYANYKYNESDDKIFLNDSQLFSRGGDCLDYARWYRKEFLKYNFTAVLVSYPVNNSTSHAFTYAYGDDGYCILDQSEISCFER